MNVTCSRFLAKGSGAELWLGTWGSKTVVLRKPLHHQEQALLDYTLIHPNILQLLGCFIEIRQRQECCVMILEWAPRGNFWTWRHSSEYRQTHGWRLCLDILRGLEYLHDTMHLLHLDIKVENSLVMADYRGVICDFDFARSLPCTLSRVAGTPECWGPEMHRLLQTHVPVTATVQWDLWSFGVLIYDLFHGTHNNYPAVKTRCLPPVAQQCLEKCLISPIWRRPTASQLLYFAEKTKKTTTKRQKANANQKIKHQRQSKNKTSTPIKK